MHCGHERLLSQAPMFFPQTVHSPPGQSHQLFLHVPVRIYHQHDQYVQKPWIGHGDAQRYQWALHSPRAIEFVSFLQGYSAILKVVSWHSLLGSWLRDLRRLLMFCHHFAENEKGER